MKDKLNKEELQEPMYLTWGRIKRKVIAYSEDNRLKELVTKMDKDMKYAKIEEKYFPLKINN